MRIEIDFDNKVIKIAEKANFKAVMDFIQTLPNWQEFSIDTHTQIVYHSHPYYVQPYYWYNDPYRITWCGSTAGISGGYTLTGDSIGVTTSSTYVTNDGTTSTNFTYGGTQQFDISEN